MSKRDVLLVAAVVIALRAFDPAAGLSGAADTSHLSAAELDRAEYLLDTLTDAQIEAALAEAEAVVS